MIYELPLSAKYVQTWTYLEAVREICQNALDSEAPFIWEVNEEGDLVISSPGVTLEPRHLILGCSNKTSDAIGQFGEGFKLAMLVLAREGKGLHIINGSQVWTPSFAFSSKYKTEILTVEVVDCCAHDGLHFIIKGLTSNELKAVVDSNLHMTPPTAYYNTYGGRILLNDPSKLYVNGLFVCEADLKYGYDILPQFITLDRDRRSAPDFSLMWQVASMWLDTGEYDHIAAEMAAGVKDFDRIEYNNDALIKHACYKKFKEQHGDGTLLVKSQEDLDNLAARGITKVVFTQHSAYHSCVTSHHEYQAQEVEITKTPLQLLEEFFAANKGCMRRKALVNFKELLKLASEWK